jgi:hypothetical protein
MNFDPLADADRFVIFRKIQLNELLSEITGSQHRQAAWLLRAFFGVDADYFFCSNFQLHYFFLLFVVCFPTPTANGTRQGRGI